MTNLKEIEKVAKDYNSDLELVTKELKKIQSMKCRMKKQKGRSDYNESLTEVLQQEEVLKEVRNLLDPKDKPVTMYNQDDIEILDYDETMKAIKSIQSKKTNSKWLTTVENDNDEYRNAIRIEKMLLEHKSNIKPIDETTIRKSDLMTIIDTIESNIDLSQDRIVEMLRGLI